MTIEFDDRALNIIGNNVSALNFYDDDRNLRARIFLDGNNNLNIGSFQVEGDEGDDESSGGLDLTDVGFLTIAGTGKLDQERVLVAGNGLQSTDGGGNGNFTLALRTPGTLSASSSNSASGNHTHAITTSSNPGAAARILASTAGGALTLEQLTVDNIRLDGNTVSSISGDLTLDPAGDDILIGSADRIGTDNFVSQLTGWRIDYDGSADFRNIFADELHVKAFIADIEQALAGGQIVSKSVALLSRDFVVPVVADITGASGTQDYVIIDGDHTDNIDVGDSFAIINSTSNDGDYTVSSIQLVTGDTQIFTNESIPTGTADGEVNFRRLMFVEDLPGFENTAVFATDDWIRLRVIDRSGGGLVVADVWGTVVNYQDRSGGEQRWTFRCRDDGDVSGETVFAGALVLDYGQTGDGYWEVTVLDESGPTPGPYSQIVTWTSDPSDSGNHTMQTRLGYLGGVSDGDFSGISGYGLYSDNVYLKGEIQAASGDVVIDSSGITITPADNEGTAGSSSSSAINFISGSDLIGQLISWADGGVDDGIRLENLGNAYFSLRRNAISGDTRAEIGGLGSSGDIRLDSDVDVTGDLGVTGALSSGDGFTTSGDLTVSRTGANTTIKAESDGLAILQLVDSDLSKTYNIEIGRSATAGDLTFRSTAGEVVRFTEDGAVGIGSDPSFRLDVQRSSAGYVAGFFNDGNASTRHGIRIAAGQDSNPSATFVQFIDGDGYPSPTAGDVVGSIQGDGAGGTDYLTSSDERLKEDITPLASSLDAVLALHPVEYRGKGAARSQPKVPGFVAQEVMAAMPSAAHYDEESDLYSLAWNKIIPHLVGAIHELNEKVEALSA